MTSLESRLRAAYADDTRAAPDTHALLAGARHRAHAIRLRRRLTVAGVAAVAVAAGMLGNAIVDRPTTGHDQIARLPPPTAPTPAGDVMTVFRFHGESGASRVVSFLDTTGRWCLATWVAGRPPDRAHTRCAPSDLGPTRHGFGRVNSLDDAGFYDGVNAWLQGVVSADVGRVTVSYDNGDVVVANLLRQPGADGAVFVAKEPDVHTPTYYRAYDEHGRLVEQLAVRHSSPPGDNISPNGAP